MTPYRLWVARRRILRAKVQTHVRFFAQTQELRCRDEAMSLVGHDLRNPLTVMVAARGGVW
jgi:hypothetical protein